MSLNDKAILGCDFLLEPFDFTILELDNSAATCADQMVVMTFVRDVVVLRLGAEVARLGDAGFAEQVQGAIDRGKAKMRIFLRQLMVHRFSRDVFLSQKRSQDQFTLASQLQLMLGQMLAKDVHLFEIFTHACDSA